MGIVNTELALGGVCVGEAKNKDLQEGRRMSECVKKGRAIPPAAAPLWP